MIDEPGGRSNKACWEHTEGLWDACSDRFWHAEVTWPPLRPRKYVTKTLGDIALPWGILTTLRCFVGRGTLGGNAENSHGFIEVQLYSGIMYMVECSTRSFCSSIWVFFICIYLCKSTDYTTKAPPHQTLTKFILFCTSTLWLWLQDTKTSLLIYSDTQLC